MALNHRKNKKTIEYEKKLNNLIKDICNEYMNFHSKLWLKLEEIMSLETVIRDDISIRYECQNRISFCHEMTHHKKEAEAFLKEDVKIDLYEEVVCSECGKVEDRY